MAEVFLSIGSNIDPERHIPAAIEDLRELFGSLSVSSIYATAAVGFAGPTFHNLVVSFESEQDPRDIARLLRGLEERHGRSRDSQKFSSRTLDVDLVLYGNRIVEEPGLRLPREEVTRYAFVLEPLAEIVPDHRHPVTDETYAELWSRFEKTGVEQRKISPPTVVK